MLAKLVDIVRAIGQVAEIPAAGIVLRIPVIGQFHLAARIARRPQEDQRIAALLVLAPPHLLQPQPLAIEAQAVLDIGHPDHGVQVFHGAFLLSKSIPVA
ncbi:hypothetical protein D3C87_1842400 [compost metagenome]